MTLHTDSRPRHARPSPASSAKRSRGLQLSAYRWAQIILGTLAFCTRFIGLSEPADKGGIPVFDEKHYAPQAWQMLRSWENIFVSGIEDNPAYGLVVHPPVGKRIDMISEWLFGYTPLGWRTMPALCSVAIVLLIMGIVRHITKSTMLASMAGIIAICDGVLLVSGRTALLDVFQCFFVVLATYFLVRDDEEMQGRMEKVLAEGRMKLSSYGPRMGFRWWRFSAGVCIGLAAGVKWSGFIYIVFFGFLSVFLDVARRHRYGVVQPVAGTLFRDTFPAIASLAVLPVAVYMFTWRSWFASENSVYRHATEAGLIREDSPYRDYPNALANWFYYQDRVLSFHAELTNSNGHYHPWESKPWAWLASTRPMVYYNSVQNDGTHYTQMLFGTPIIWWISVPVMLWAIWCWIVGRDRRWAWPVVGYAAGWLPWLMDMDRQMYFFYATNMVPFLIIAITLCLGQLSRWSLAGAAGGAGVAGAAGSAGSTEPTKAADHAGAAGATMPAEAAEVPDTTVNTLNPANTANTEAATPATPAIPTKATSPTKSARFSAKLRTAWQTQTGLVLSCVYLGAVIAMFFYFLPIMVALPISAADWNAHMWLPSWK